MLWRSDRGIRVVGRVAQPYGTVHEMADQAQRLTADLDCSVTTTTLSSIQKLVKTSFLMILDLLSNWQFL